jgi:hypothetical protein
MEPLEPLVFFSDDQGVFVPIVVHFVKENGRLASYFLNHAPPPGTWCMRT